MNKLINDKSIYVEKMDKVVGLITMRKYSVILFTVISSLLFSATSFAIENSEQFLLKNLERERAAVLDVLFDKKLSFTERQLKASTLLQRLATVERLALNSDTAEHSQLAKQVFSQYELSFLLHASAEQNEMIVEHWLNQLAISTNDIEQGWSGER